MKLMLLIIPTIQKIVKPMANGALERDRPGAERVVEVGDRDPGRDREQRDAELAQQLPAGPELEVVVEEADDRRQRAAGEQRDDAPAAAIVNGTRRARAGR